MSLFGRGRPIPWQHCRRIQGAQSREDHVSPKWKWRPKHNKHAPAVGGWGGCGPGHVEPEAHALVFRAASGHSIPPCSAQRALPLDGMDSKQRQRQETPDKMHGHGVDAILDEALAIRLLIALDI